MSRRYRYGDIAVPFRLMQCALASAVRRSAAAQARQGELVTPVSDRVHAVGADRRVGAVIAKRAGVRSGTSRLFAGPVAVHLPDLVIEVHGIHAPSGLYVVFGVHAGSVAGTPSLNLPRCGSSLQRSARALPAPPP